MKNYKIYLFLVIFTSLVTSSSFAKDCISLVEDILSKEELLLKQGRREARLKAKARFELKDKKRTKNKAWGITNLEKSIRKKSTSKIGLKKQYLKLIKKLANRDPERANMAMVAWTKRYAPNGGGADSLLIDISSLPNPAMKKFIEGPWRKFTGRRGVSEPFVKIYAQDNNTLIIEHLDEIPKMIKWVDELTSSQTVRVQKFEGISYQLLELPAELNKVADLKKIDHHIVELVTGSHMHPGVDASINFTMSLGALLHNGKLIQNRASQKAFVKLWNHSFTDIKVIKKLESLTYVAPTATGKTRILGIALENMLEKSMKMMKDHNDNIFNNFDKLDIEERKIITELLDIRESSSTKKIVSEFKLARFTLRRRILNRMKIKEKGSNTAKKLSILMTKDVDVISQGASAIGLQLKNKYPDGYRMIQWGGNNANKETFAELLELIRTSDVPVVLFTSSTSLFLKARKEMVELFEYANFIAIDEIQQFNTEATLRAINLAIIKAQEDRTKRSIDLPLTILGVTATPVENEIRTVNILQHSFWALIDTPIAFTKSVLNGKRHSQNVLEWVRVPLQLMLAKRAGEITAPDSAIFIDPNTIEEGLDSLFRVQRTQNNGYVTRVQRHLLKKAYLAVRKNIVIRGKGVIDCYPRDAHTIAEEFSKASGKNFVPLGPELTMSQRNIVYNAFRDQIPYEGKQIHAIVGPMKPGLDFPFIGWYLSIKKYVKFPEIYQGPGRAFRLYLHKLEPFVAFFGEAPFAVAFKSITRQVLEDAGPMIDTIKATTGFTGRKKPSIQNPDSQLGKLMGNLNTSIQILFRKNPKLTKDFGTLKDPSPNAIKKLQKLLYKTRSSKYEFEHSKNIITLINEIHAFPFYKNSLEETWAYCDRYLKLLKKLEKGLLPKKTSEEDLLVINNKEKMALMLEFFQMKRWLGSVPRLLLKDMKLEMHGITQIADAINAFIIKNNRMPNIIEDEPLFAESILRKNIDKFMSSSSRDSFIEKFSFESRTILDPIINNTTKGTIEGDLELFITQNNRLPNFIYSKLAGGIYTNEDLLEQNLAKRIEAFIRTGKLKFKDLSSNAHMIIDQSEIYQRIVQELIEELEIISDPAFQTMGNGLANYTKTLSINMLKGHRNFKVIHLLEELAQKSYPESQKLLNRLEKLLKQVQERTPASISPSQYGNKPWFKPLLDYFLKVPFIGPQFKL